MNGVMSCLSALFLVGGATLCLLAAAGVLRLPDFFMRMHAATKAGVVGCGLVLIGAGFADGSAATWLKVGIAVLFLLLTTPIAGHLLGRAAYVGGAPLWQGTTIDDLRSVLPRGRFEGGDRLARQREANQASDCIILALAKGPHMDAAIAQAIALARKGKVELCGIAIIDVPRLCNVGPVPIGAGWHASRCASAGSAWRARRRRTSSKGSRRRRRPPACVGPCDWKKAAPPGSSRISRRPVAGSPSLPSAGSTRACWSSRWT